MKVWSVETGEKLAEYPTAWGARFLKTHPNNRWVVGPMTSESSNQVEEGQLALWDIDSGKIVRVFKGLRNWAMEVDFSFDGKRLAVAGVEGVALVWDVESGKELQRFAIDSAMAVNQVAFSVDGAQLLTGHRDGHVHKWNMKTGALMQKMVCHGDEIAAVLVTGDGTRMITASKGDSCLRVWHLETGQRLAEFESGLPSIVDVRMTKQENAFILGGSNGEVRILRVK